MTTFLAITGLVIIIAGLYLLSDTITEKLSGGKSFSSNETKGFK